MATFSVGDHIVYRKQKVSTHPGPRAVKIDACETGDNYIYFVDKYWTVKDIQNDGTVEVVTRRGKSHQLDPDDPRIRKSNLIDELLHRSRFPNLEAIEANA